MDDARTRTELELDVGPEDSIHRHPLDPISIAFGAIFTLIGALFLLGDVDAATLNAGWAWAGLSAAFGMLFIAIGVRRHQRSIEPKPPETPTSDPPS
jgi:hypothetical protein